MDLSRVGSTETKALLMGLLVMKLQEYRMAMQKGTDSSLRHVTVLEEAHNLLKRTSTEQSSDSANLLGKSVEMPVSYTHLYTVRTPYRLAPVKGGYRYMASQKYNILYLSLIHI